MTNHLQLLKERIQQNKIAIFVGAGMSTNVGLPNWNELIYKILDGLGAKEPLCEKFKQGLKDGILTPIEVLGKIESLKEATIEILYREFKSFNSVSPTTVHSKIGKLSNQILTTNYDDLLERVNVGFEKVSYTNTFKIAKLSEIPKYIFKIHGDIEEPQHCILFPSQYQELYSIGDKSSIFEVKKIISDKSILFIGFSLSDPYVKYVFDYITSLYTGFSPEHFIVTTSNQDVLPKKFNPIVIGNYGELDDLLDELISVKIDARQQQEILKQTIEKDSNNTIITITSPSDSPPENKYWVGREKELENIDNENFKVIFITGIGGQGKSALAAHYVRDYQKKEEYEFGDWRDFKEQTNRFHTKLGSIIGRLTKNIDFKSLELLSTEELVDSFFLALGKRKIVFVFDNVDSYIDLEKFKPVGGLGYFFEKALYIDHNSKFIFTGRPFIREASVNFYQISLSGLSEVECMKLFHSYRISLKEDEFITFSKRVHKLTKGHPLWLNLIAGQAVRGIDVANVFINKIENKTTFDENDFSAILSEKILTEVWNSLNNKQKTLIRGISETVKPESEENLKTIMSSELSIRQFTRALRTLKNLNLVESLSDGKIELHPLVKEFIINKYSRNERLKYITLWVQYYDNVIYILKPRLGSNLTIEEFQNWTSKVELEIEKRDFLSALRCLHEVRSPIFTAGYNEEYLRVAEILYNTIDWRKAISNEYPYFHDEFIQLVATQTQMGQFDLSNKNLNKYVEYIPGKSAYYLAYCSQKTYNLWYQKLFDDAISIAEEGLFLLDESSINDTFSLKHNHALALRDSKSPENVAKALDYFVMNEKIEDVLNRKKINNDLGGHYYGNIGKCLDYLNQQENALFCYLVSLKLLFEEDSSNTILNRGYACFWIADLLIRMQKPVEALYFLKYSIYCWEQTSPPRVQELKTAWNKVKAIKETKDAIESVSILKTKSYCKDYIDRYMSMIAD